MTKIEGDIIEEFARHTLRFVDNLIVVDNGSLDAARDILSALISEGLAIRIWEGEAVASSTTFWTVLARRAFAAIDTDYLLLLDVDEFVRAPSRAGLEDALGALGGEHGLVPWVTYVPSPDDDLQETRVLARVRHRLRRETRLSSKVFVHRSFMQHPGASIMGGSHGVFDPDGSAASTILGGIDLAHIPVRSVKQIQRKALLGWPQFIALGFDNVQGIAYQWRRLYERLVDDPHWDANELFQFAWHYLADGVEAPELLLDPLPPTDRRYDREEPELLSLSISLTRQFALAYAARAEPQRNGHREATQADRSDFDDDTKQTTGAAVADEIVRMFTPRTVLDVSFGTGFLVESLWDRGVRAEGIDISEIATETARRDRRYHYRPATPTERIPGTFDLVTCIDTLERVAENDAKAAVANICTVAETVIFSPTPMRTPTDFRPGDCGNVCPPIVWIESFAEHDFGPDLLVDATFLTPQTMVFRKGNSCDAPILRAYALLNRYRRLLSERLESIEIERARAQRAEAAQRFAEVQCAREIQLRVEAQATIAAGHVEAQASIDANHAAAQATIEVVRAESRAAIDTARAEVEAALEAQRNAEAQAVLDAAQRLSDVLAAQDAQRRAQTQMALEVRRYEEAQASNEARIAAQRQANVQAQLVAEAEMNAQLLRSAKALADASGELTRYKTQLHDIQRLSHDMQKSHSWRLTRPIRVAALLLRKQVSRLRR